MPNWVLGMNPVTRGMAVYQVRDDAKLGLGYERI